MTLKTESVARINFFCKIIPVSQWTLLDVILRIIRKARSKMVIHLQRLCWAKMHNVTPTLNLPFVHMHVWIATVLLTGKTYSLWIISVPKNLIHDHSCMIKHLRRILKNCTTSHWVVAVIGQSKHLGNHLWL